MSLTFDLSFEFFGLACVWSIEESALTILLGPVSLQVDFRPGVAA